MGKSAVSKVVERTSRYLMEDGVDKSPADDGLLRGIQQMIKVSWETSPPLINVF